MGAPCFNDRVPSFTEFERAYLVCYLIPFIDFYWVVPNIPFTFGFTVDFDFVRRRFPSMYRFRESHMAGSNFNYNQRALLGF